MEEIINSPEIQELIKKFNDITIERNYWRDKCDQLIKQKENNGKNKRSVE